MTNTHSLTHIAFIGAGRMGGPMARNAQRAGFSVSAFDVALAARAALTASGVIACDSIAAVTRNADIIVTMLPTDDALVDAMRGSGGVLESLPPGALVIDMSTSQLSTSQSLAADVQARGGAMLDAPVSGGTGGAESATLSIMVGGGRDAFERAWPLFTALGTTITHIGANGMGLVAKYVNQMLMEAAFCAVAEAFAFAVKAGAPVQPVFDAVRNGHGGSRVLDMMIPQCISGDFGSGRELALHAKDGAYAHAAALSVGAWAPVTELTHALFAQATAAGLSGLSAPSIVKLFEERASVSLKTAV